MEQWVISMALLLFVSSVNGLYTLCAMIDELYPMEITLNDANNGELEMVNTDCWHIELSQCYFLNISSNQSIALNSLTLAINDRNVGTLTNVIDANYFCVSMDFEMAPFAFSANEKNEKFSIYHRQRAVYSDYFGDDDCLRSVCNGFKATMSFYDILSLRLPQMDKECDQMIDFSANAGFCECFCGKIMIYAIDGMVDSCLSVCDFLNDGCSKESMIGAILSPNTIIGCDTPIVHGLQSVASSVCGDGFHICASSEELAYLHLTNSICAHLTPMDTFYATLDDKDCANQQMQKNVINGCGNNQNDESIPIIASFCDIFSHSLSISSSNDANWHILEGEEGDGLIYSVRKRTDSEGGILCCVDSDYSNDSVLTFSGWQLIVLQIFHAIFVFIFFVSFLFVFVRLIRHCFVRRCIQKCAKWKQRKNFDRCVEHGTFYDLRECVKESGYEECAICLEEYGDLHKLIVLNCGHHYHEECGKKWLLQNDACPLCLQSIAHAKDLRNSSKEIEVVEEIEMSEEEKKE